MPSRSRPRTRLSPGHTEGLGGGPLIAIHPGSKWPSRRWPAERYAALADALADEHGARILITGGAAERELAAHIAAIMCHEPLVLAGKTSLGALGALMSRLDLFVGNDTGPSHLAVAVGCPSLMLVGPGNLERWRPLDSARHAVLHHPVECSPCEHPECPIDHRCFAQLTAEEALGEARRLLGSTPRRKPPGAPYSA